MNGTATHIFRSANMGRRGLAGGFSIVSALFLLIVLASLGAFIVNISTTQSTTMAQDVQGSRAYHAAQAGLEWGLYGVLDPANVTGAATAPGNPNWPNMPNTLPDGTLCAEPLPAAAITTTLTIEGFSVDISCRRYPAGAVGASGPPVYTESGDVRSLIVYELTANAHSPAGVAVGSPDYVEREVQTSASYRCRALDGVAPSYECS